MPVALKLLLSPFLFALLFVGILIALPITASVITDKKYSSFYPIACVDNPLGCVSLFPQKVKFLLATMHDAGKFVNPDKEIAFELFAEAAQQGHVDAQLIVGLIYADGIGVEKDDKQGIRWIKQAAQQGHPDAQFLMGVLYEKGISVKRSIRESYIWYRIAHFFGSEAAAQKLKIIVLPSDLSKSFQQIAIERIKKIQSSKAKS